MKLTSEMIVTLWALHHQKSPGCPQDETLKALVDKGLIEIKDDFAGEASSMRITNKGSELVSSTRLVLKQCYSVKRLSTDIEIEEYIFADKEHIWICDPRWGVIKKKQKYLYVSYWLTREDALNAIENSLRDEIYVAQASLKKARSAYQRFLRKNNPK